MSDVWPWLALVGLGAYHGLNPAMGWLFAVARGLQERRLGAVWAALPPIALGHALSVLLVLLAAALAGVALPERHLRLLSASLLVGYGLFLLLRPAHPRWVGMRVGFKDLTLWSFLMASAHGAGLMLVPLLLGGPDAGTVSHGGSHAASSAGADLLGALVHTLAMFAGMALAAFLVYQRFGVAILRRSWVNLDLLWAGALVLAGVLTFVL